MVVRSNEVVGGNLRKCPHCQVATYIDGDLCVRCLLQIGLGSIDDCAKEGLRSDLTEIVESTEIRFIGNYQISNEIGRGGMGVIYRARQRYSGRVVALKRLLCHHAGSRENLARFRREAQAAASLDHPNILPIYEVGETADGIPFFSMKLAAGGSLTSFATTLQGNPRLSVILMARVARAVHYAH